MTLNDLYAIADVEDVEVLAYQLPKTKSMSIQTEDMTCYIGIDDTQMESTAEKKTRLAHELGHCALGAFYNRYSKYDLISKHEYKADKWACENLMPKADVEAALRQGYVEIWQLAEYFEVTEDIVKKAMWIYFDKEV